MFALVLIPALVVMDIGTEECWSEQEFWSRRARSRITLGKSNNILNQRSRKEWFFNSLILPPLSYHSRHREEVEASEFKNSWACSLFFPSAILLL